MDYLEVCPQGPENCQNKQLFTFYCLAFVATSSNAFTSTSPPLFIMEDFALACELDRTFICSTSSLVCWMKVFRAPRSVGSIRNFAGFFSTICTVSSRSSRSHSIERKEFRSSVAAHSCSSAERMSMCSSPNLHRSYSSLVFNNALRTSLEIIHIEPMSQLYAHCFNY